METTVGDRLVGRVIDGRYRVLGVVARGGMATVYRAVDLRLDRAVAVKVMLPALADDPDFVARFQREARSAARLSHPSVVSVYDQGRDGDLVYLVMEYVEGRTLRDLLRERGALPPETALRILSPVLEALASAHAAGIVHRDIKPENVLIGEDGHVTVADFGLARAIAASTATLTQGVLIGTVAYLSPEQVERGMADPRSDVYSAGILLFEMVTGTVPHDGDSPLAVAYQHVNEDVPAPSRLRAGLPPEIDALVSRATRRRADERYADARGFQADVMRVAAGLPAAEPLARATVAMPGGGLWSPQMPPPPTPVPVQPRTSQPAIRPRRRLAAWVAVVVILLAVIGAGAAGWWLSTPRGVGVPSVAGTTVDDARGQLLGLGLAVEVAREFSEAVPADRVIDSVPGQGAVVEPGSAVRLVVSKGPQRFPVPGIVGLSADDAETALTRESLRLGATVMRFDEAVAAGLVISSDPEPGTPLAADSEVDIVVSKGPRPVPVPRVAGTASDEASAALEALRLGVTVSEEYSDAVPEGIVIGSNPRAGTKVAPGHEVTLIVSKGPRPVEVPALVDMQREEAIAALEALGLVADVQEALFTPLNRVYSQSPEPGTLVPPGSTVTISIV